MKTIRRMTDDSLHRWRKAIDKELDRRKELAHRERLSALRDPKVVINFLDDMSRRSCNSFSKEDLEFVHAALDSVGNTLGRHKKSRAKKYFDESTYLSSREGRCEHPGSYGDEQFGKARDKLLKILLQM